MAGKRTSPPVRLPRREEVPVEDQWDLARLYADDAAWERDLARLEKQIGRYADFRGRLKESPQVLAQALRLDERIDRLAERLGTYVLLKVSEDQTRAKYLAMRGRYQTVAMRAADASSFLRPEILKIPARRMNAFLEDPALKPYELTLKRILRYRPHTLKPSEERLLALQSKCAQTPATSFRQLTDADMRFGSVRDETGTPVELGHATFIRLLRSPKRAVRKKAFHQYYREFQEHQYSLAALLAGSIEQDVYYARIRNYPSALDRALFPDEVPRSVYENLISTVRARLEPLWRYYDLRRRALRLKNLHFYDTYVSIVPDLDVDRSWDEAVELVLEALAPLGKDYTSVLGQGLRGRWCDRYPNQNKQSGAFSCGSYDGDPYILMNYESRVFESVFTLAHEAGHSMHSYYSAKSQPFRHYNYTIFVAEVASTFNEQLLAQYLLARARDDRERAYLICREIDDIRATLIRQTMFAEFEKTVHEMAESGEPLTLDAFRQVYGELLRAYHGPDMILDDVLELECLRIPHFYRAFYVYKYATGIAAAIALARQVLTGDRRALRRYLGFLKGGCSKPPLQLLRDAGVDMASPEPIETALDHFARLVDELDALLA